MAGVKDSQPGTDGGGREATSLSTSALVLLRVGLTDSSCKFSRFLKEILNGAKCILYH